MDERSVRERANLFDEQNQVLGHVSSLLTMAIPSDVVVLVLLRSYDWPIKSWKSAYEITSRTVRAAPSEMSCSKRSDKQPVQFVASHTPVDGYTELHDRCLIYKQS